MFDTLLGGSELKSRLRAGYSKLFGLGFVLETGFWFPGGSTQQLCFTRSFGRTTICKLTEPLERRAFATSQVLGGRPVVDFAWTPFSTAPAVVSGLKASDYGTKSGTRNKEIHVLPWEVAEKAEAMMSPAMGKIGALIITILGVP